MAYGDSGSGDLSNKTVTFKGFSSRADKSNFKLYDFEVAKQDLINRLSVRKGERVENPVQSLLSEGRDEKGLPQACSHVFLSRTRKA